MILCGYRTIFRLSSSSFPVNSSPFLSLSSGTFHRLSKISSFSCIFLGKFKPSIVLNHFSNICFFTIQTQFHPQNKKFPKSNLVFSQIVFSRINLYFFQFFLSNWPSTFLPTSFIIILIGIFPLKSINSHKIFLLEFVADGDSSRIGKRQKQMAKKNPTPLKNVPKFDNRWFWATISEW